MAAQVKLIDYLRSRSKVDCDLLDVSVASTLGPFVDCTSNQAIAYHELVKPENEAILKKSAQLGHAWQSEFPTISFETLAVDISMVTLSLRIAPKITGYIHIQTNPFNATSVDKTVENARRLVSLCQRVDPKCDVSRVCIKVASSWEGLQACRELEASGIRTLATTLFTMEQAALAAQARCLYIAPYVNELKVHVDPTYHVQDKLLSLCASLQHYYEQHSYRTIVLAASLTSIDEVTQLAGVSHITISAPLLKELSREDVESEVSSQSLFNPNNKHLQPFDERVSLDDESAFRTAFSKANGGAGEVKLAQAVDIFSDMQRKMEDLIKKVDPAK